MAYQQQQGTYQYQYDPQQYYATAQTATYAAYSSQAPSSQTTYGTTYTGQTAAYAGYSTTSNAGQASVSNVNQSAAYQTDTSSYYQPSYSTGTTNVSATTTTTQANTSYYTQQPASQAAQSYDAYQSYYQASSATPTPSSSTGSSYQYQGQSYYTQSQPQAQAPAVANSTSYNTGSTTSASSSYTSTYNNTYAYSTSQQQQPSQTATQNQYYDYSSYGTQATSSTPTAVASYYDSSQYPASEQNSSSYTVAGSVGTQSQDWSGQNSAYGSTSASTYSQPQSQYNQPQSYSYSTTSAAVPNQYGTNTGYASSGQANSSGGTPIANQTYNTSAGPQSYQANRNTRPNVSVGGHNQRNQYPNRPRPMQGHKQDSSSGYTNNSRSSVPSWKGNETNKKEPPFNRRGVDQRSASNNFHPSRQSQQPFQASRNQGPRDSYHQQKNERFGRPPHSSVGSSKEGEVRNLGQRRNAPDQRSGRRQGTFGQLKEIQRSDGPSQDFSQKRDHQGNLRANQARDTSRGPRDNLRPVMASSQAVQTKNQPSPRKSGFERNSSDARDQGNRKQDQQKVHGQEKGTPKEPKQSVGPPERRPPSRSSQQSSDGGRGKFPPDKRTDSAKSGMGPPSEKVRFRGPHPMAPRGPGPMSPRGRFPPPRFPGDEMPFMPRPFGPRGPFPPDEVMFGPPVRGRGRFRGGPHGPRPRFPFPGLPPPWELDPPFFPGDMGPPPPYFDEFDDRFMEDEFDSDIPPHMLPPRKQRRSSGSPHRGDPLPRMGPGRRPGSPDHFMHMEGPFEFGPRGPPFRPFPPGDFHRAMPPRLPSRSTIPPFTGTKDGKFGKLLAAKKQKDGQKNDKREKSKVKEDNELQEKCNEEGCGPEASPAVPKNHIKMRDEADLPATESRDKEDTKKWIEDRKKKYPTADTIESKKQAEKEKERVGAVLTTKEFGKMKKKKKTASGNGKDEGKEAENQEKADAEGPGDVKDEDSKEKEEEDTAQSEEKDAEKDSEKDEKVDKKENEENSSKDTTKASEKDEDGNQTEENKTADETADREKDEEAEIKTETEEAVESVKKEVIFQPVKTEVIKKFKRDKSSKREAWRTSRPVQKIVTKGGKHRKATLLEMLLAPEVRHERNMILQCVRHTVNKNFFEPKKAAEVKEKRESQGKDDVVMEEGEERLKTNDEEVAPEKQESEPVEDAGKDATGEEKDKDAEMMEAEPADEKGGEKAEEEEKVESEEKKEAAEKKQSEDDKSQETME